MDKGEIKRLVKQGESETLEFKQFEKLEEISDRGRKQIAGLFASLANKKGGTVLFGVTDEGKFQGRTFNVKDIGKFEQMLVNIADEKCKPPIHPEEIGIEKIGKSSILYIQILPGGSDPHLVNGVCYIRVGKHNRPITDPSKIREFYDKGGKKKGKVTTIKGIKLDKAIESPPIILLEDYELPYIRINSKDRLGIVSFGESWGFYEESYFIESTKVHSDLKEAEKILKAFYNTFGKSYSFDNPTFMINQIGEDDDNYDNNYSWFGFGPSNFIKALKEQDRRYSEANIKNPYKREMAGYVDNRGDEFLFYMALQPWTGEGKKNGRLNFIDVGFIFGSHPFDNRAFIDFYDEAGLIAPEFVHRSERLKSEKLFLRERDIKLKKVGLISYKGVGDEEYWATKVICENPFHENKKIDPRLSVNEKIVINLRDHHLATDKEQYHLLKVIITPLPSHGFDFHLVNFMGTW